jgi:creatinine amidohydrolase
VQGHHAHHAVAQMTWDEVADRIAQGAIAILPVGAAAKQHGLHLPMNTDQIQAEWAAAEIAVRIDALIWPTIPYGHYPAFTAYAGSNSLSERTFTSLVRELAVQILGFGCRRLVVLDTGVSTAEPIARALARLPASRVLHLALHQGRRYREAQAQAAQHHGSHADELETSIMLALEPGLVDMERAEASPMDVAPVPGALTPSDPASPNYSCSGSFGDPTLATSATGEKLLAAITDDLVEAIALFAGNAAHGGRRHRA